MFLISRSLSCTFKLPIINSDFRETEFEHKKNFLIIIFLELKLFREVNSELIE